MERIQDKDVLILAGLSAALEKDYVVEKDPWQGSPFQWIQARPSRQKGAIGEALVAGWAAAKGLDVVRNLNSDADRIVNGHRIEIKYSNLWSSTGVFKFQQIRDQQYDYCFCLGLSPWDAQAWFIPKHLLMGDFSPGLSSQHGGRSGTDTRWLSFEAANPPEWLAPFGGRLSDVYKLILKEGRGAHRGR